MRCRAHGDAVRRRAIHAAVIRPVLARLDAAVVPAMLHGEQSESTAGDGLDKWTATLATCLPAACVLAGYSSWRRVQIEYRDLALLQCHPRAPTLPLARPLSLHVPSIRPPLPLTPSYSQSQLYKLVSDIPCYAAFIPFCTSSAVLAGPSPSSPSSSSSAPRRRRVTQRDWTPTDEPFDVEAELRVGFGGLEEAYVSRVRGRPFESVTAEAAEEAALFKSLKTTCEWGVEGCMELKLGRRGAVTASLDNAWISLSTPGVVLDRICPLDTVAAATAAIALTPRVAHPQGHSPPPRHSRPTPPTSRPHPRRPRPPPTRACPTTPTPRPTRSAGQRC
jgi:ribosome-associated toxin RatA of RatAB toxin-antitoxin module